MAKVAVAQVDSVRTHAEWADPHYSQEKKIYQGIFISPLVNPALVGFDRQLVVQYRFDVSNTSVPVPDQNIIEPAFWQQTATIEGAIAGPRRNLGISIAYQGGQRWRAEVHRLAWAHSYRFRFRDHQFTLGMGISFRWSDNDMQGLTWGDMIDPRGGVYYPTQESGRNREKLTSGLSLGFVYSFRRLLFSYSARGEDSNELSSAWIPDDRLYHDLCLQYHFKLPTDFTLTPLFHVQYSHSSVYAPLLSWHPALYATYRDRIMFGLSLPYLQRYQFEIAAQFLDGLRVSASVAHYVLKKSSDANGLALAGISLRYLIPIWKK
jgi:hypothetical protein